MIFQNLKDLLIALTFVATFCLFSCTKDKSTNIDLWTKKAENSVKKYPDSTLFYTHKILSSPSQKDFSDKEKLQLYALRQKAFAATENMDSVVAVGKKIRVLASEIPDSLAMAQSLLLVKGDIDFSNQQEMIAYLPGAIATFKKNRMPFNEAKLRGSYGAILCWKGDFTKAQFQLIQAYKILDQLDSINSKINVCINIGNAFFGSNDTKSALKYYREAYENAVQFKDSTKISSALLNIGTYYSKSNLSIDSSYFYYQKALQFVPKKSDYFLKMKIDYNLARLQYEKGNLEFAKSTYKVMLDNCINSKLLEGESRARMGLAEVYEKEHHYDEAMYEVNRAIHLSDSLGVIYDALAFRPTLVSIYKKKGNYKAALAITDQIKKMNDSLHSLDKQKVVAELALQYDTEKKEIENKNLIQTLALRQKIILGLFICLFVVVFLWRQRNKLYLKNKHAYAVLIQKYKKENESRNEKASTPPLSILNSGPTDIIDKTTSLYQKLVTYYETEKPYLDSKLKADFIAKELGVPQRDISVALKNNGFSSFTNFNNKFRVEEVKKCFDDIQYNSIKTVVIATQSGFGSKQPFYTAFEEFTGLNPGFYRSEIAKS